jgi:hypothetical protein
MKYVITGFIALVWLVNGLYCKVLHGVPRHEQIVAAILGDRYAHELTVAIGLLEIGMAAWVVSRIKPRWCGIVQIVVVLLMNLLEFSLVPELLLFGWFNLLIACVFSYLVYWHTFIFNHSAK